MDLVIFANLVAPVWKYSALTY